MARFGDEGPYAIGNVKIITTDENVREAGTNAKMKRWRKERAQEEIRFFTVSQYEWSR
jgi:hypothetical protein